MIVTLRVVRDPRAKEPPEWDRAEVVFVDGRRKIAYDTSYDLTTILHSIAFAGALATAVKVGRDCNCAAIRAALGPVDSDDLVCGHEPDCVATNTLGAIR